jgi:hypothetical protein
LSLGLILEGRQTAQQAKVPRQSDSVSLKAAPGMVAAKDVVTVRNGPLSFAFRAVRAVVASKGASGAFKQL